MERPMRIIVYRRVLPRSLRDTSPEAIYDRRHIWTRCGERILFTPGEQKQHVYGEGWWQYIVAAVQLYYTSERLFIRNDEKSRKKREKSADDLRRRFSFFFFFFAFTVAAPLFPCQTQKEEKKGRLSVFEARSMRKIACVSDTHRCQSLLKKKEDFWLLMLLAAATAQPRKNVSCCLKTAIKTKKAKNFFFRMFFCFPLALALL